MTFAERRARLLTHEAPPWSLAYSEAVICVSNFPTLRFPVSLEVAESDADAAWYVASAVEKEANEAGLPHYELDGDVLFCAEFRKFTNLLHDVGDSYRAWDGFGTLELPALLDYEFDLPLPDRWDTFVDRRDRCDQLESDQRASFARLHRGMSVKATAVELA